MACGVVRHDLFSIAFGISQGYQRNPWSNPKSPNVPEGREKSSFVCKDGFSPAPLGIRVNLSVEGPLGIEIGTFTPVVAAVFD